MEDADANAYTCMWFFNVQLDGNADDRLKQPTCNTIDQSPLIMTNYPRYRKYPTTHPSISWYAYALGYFKRSSPVHEKHSHMPQDLPQRKFVRS
jgi:hypothetical protein